LQLIGRKTLSKKLVDKTDTRPMALAIGGPLQTREKAAADLARVLRHGERNFINHWASNS
jgi:hypothetical protein